MAFGFVSLISAICSSVTDPALVDAHIGRTFKLVHAACFWDLNDLTIFFIFLESTVWELITQLFLWYTLWTDFTCELLRFAREAVMSTTPSTTNVVFSRVGSWKRSSWALHLAWAIDTIGFSVTVSDASNALAIETFPFIGVAAMVTIWSTGMSFWSSSTRKDSPRAIWVTTLIFIWSISTVIEPITLEVLSNILPNRTLEFLSSAETKRLIWIIPAIVDSIALHVLTKTESVGTEESMDCTGTVVLIRSIRALRGGVTQPLISYTVSRITFELMRCAGSEV